MLDATEVGDVWGIGRKTAPRLNEAGLRSVLDLLKADLPALRRQFGIVMEKTLRELRGTPCHDVDDAPQPNQQIMCSRSFGAPVTELPDLILIDGRFRLGCFLSAVLCTTRPVTILWDDYKGRGGYMAAERWFPVAEMIGRMARFEIGPRVYGNGDFAAMLPGFFSSR